MYCPKCAAPIDGVRFCRSCGANVSLVSQALTGRLPESTQAEENRYGWWCEWWPRYREKKPLTIEGAIQNVFLGLGFLLASLAVWQLFPGGRFWWFWLLIPSFALLGEGIGQFVRLRYEQRSASPHQLNKAVLAAPRRDELTVPTTSKLTPPPTVTEETTRHLETISREKA